MWRDRLLTWMWSGVLHIDFYFQSIELNKTFLYVLETRPDDEAITMKDSLRLQQPCAVWFGLQNEIKVWETKGLNTAKKINSMANKGLLSVAFSPHLQPTQDSVFIQRPWMFGWEPAWWAAVATKRACDCLICVDYISPQPVCFIPLHRHCPWSLAIFPLMSHIMKWMKCHFQSIAMLIQLN